MTKSDKFRLSILAGTCAILVGAWVVRAHAEEGAPSMCRPLAEMKAAAIAHNVRWTTLSTDQFQFVRGVFVTAPSTPAGMPFGDSAALVMSADGNSDGGVVVFVDGDKACEPMPIPKELVAFLMDLGTITHEGNGS
jgi:hypothetical protein